MRVKVHRATSAVSPIKLFAESISEARKVLSVSLNRFDFENDVTALTRKDDDLADLLFGISGGENFKYSTLDADSEKKLRDALNSYAASDIKFDLVFWDIGGFPDSIFNSLKPEGILVVRKPSPQFDSVHIEKAIKEGKAPSLNDAIDSDPLTYIYDKTSNTDFKLNALIKFPINDPLSPKQLMLSRKVVSGGKSETKIRKFIFDQPNEFCVISKTASPITLFSPVSVSDVLEVSEAIQALVTDGKVANYPVVDRFVSFIFHRAEREISSLNSTYKNFKTEPLSSLTDDIVDPNTYWRRKEGKLSSQRTLYIPNRISIEEDNFLIILGDERFNEYIKPHEDEPEQPERAASMIRLECKSELIAEYLSIFFKSDLGRLTLAESVDVNRTSTIDKKRLRNSAIPIPDRNSQERIRDAHQSLQKLTAEINRLHSELFTNPLDQGTNDKIAEMLSASNSLTTEDSFRQLVRRGESKTTEFKTTFQMCIRTGEMKSDVETSALKSIVGFMNADGGALLLGVADDQTIVGLDQELKKFHGKKGNPLDSFTLRLKDKIKRRIGEASVSLVDIRPLTLSDKIVFQVDCSMASEGVYLDGEDFYLRVPAATERMKGPQLEKYIRQRFNN